MSRGPGSGTRMGPRRRQRGWRCTSERAGIVPLTVDVPDGYYHTCLDLTFQAWGVGSLAAQSVACSDVLWREHNIDKGIVDKSTLPIVAQRRLFLSLVAVQ